MINAGDILALLNNLDTAGTPFDEINSSDVNMLSSSEEKLLDKLLFELVVSESSEGSDRGDGRLPRAESLSDSKNTGFGVSRGLAGRRERRVEKVLVEEELTKGSMMSEAFKVGEGLLMGLVVNMNGGMVRCTAS